MLKDFSEKLSVKVFDGNYNTLSSYPKTDNINDIEYFISFEHLEPNFERWNEVKILSNYIHCPELQIYKKTVVINGGIRYKYWKDVVFKDLRESDREKQYEYARNRWGNLMEYIPQLVTAIGGNNLIFYEDDRFEQSRELCYEGKEISEVSNAMKLHWMPTEFQKIIRYKDIHEVKYGWYYHKINNDI